MKKKILILFIILNIKFKKQTLFNCKIILIVLNYKDLFNKSKKNLLLCCDAILNFEKFLIN